MVNFEHTETVQLYLLLQILISKLLQRTQMNIESTTLSDNFEITEHLWFTVVYHDYLFITIYLYSSLLQYYSRLHYKLCYGVVFQW